MYSVPYLVLSTLQTQVPERPLCRFFSDPEYSILYEFCSLHCKLRCLGIQRPTCHQSWPSCRIESLHREISRDLAVWRRRLLGEKRDKTLQDPCGSLHKSHPVFTTQIKLYPVSGLLPCHCNFTKRQEGFRVLEEGGNKQ